MVNRARGNKGEMVIAEDTDEGIRGGKLTHRSPLSRLILAYNLRMVDCQLSMSGSSCE